MFSVNNRALVNKKSTTNKGIKVQGNKTAYISLYSMYSVLKLLVV